MFDPAKENERESYFYSLLLLFVLFRNEADLVEEGKTAEIAFNRHMAKTDSLNTHSEKLQKMLKARESVKKINEARPAQEEDVKDSNPVEDDGPQVVGEATSAMHDMLDLQQNESEGGASVVTQCRPIVHV